MPLRLLDAAAVLFRAKGFSGATTRELASVVGIRNASLYHHFRSKDDLLYTLCVESLTKLTKAAEDAVASSSDAIEQLRALVVAHLTTSLADQDKHAAMLMELRSLTKTRRDEVVALRDRYEAHVRKVLDAGQAAGSVRGDVSAQVLTLALLNLLNWTILWFRPDGPLSATEIASEFASIYLEGVSAN